MKKKYKVTVNGKAYEVEVEEIAEVKAAPLTTKGREESRVQETESMAVKAGPEEPADIGMISAPMPGTIIDVRVRPGEQVRVGQTVLIEEAMKMENEIISPVVGIVKEVFVQNGSTVNAGQTLLVIE